MKIAIVTANFGGIDEVKEIPKQTIEYDRYIVDEHNCWFPLSTLDNRSKARYIKIMMHRYLPQYDFYIWLDGRVEVTSEKFIQSIFNSIGKEEDKIFLTQHPARKDAYDELEFILHEMNKGNHYLIERYGKQQLRKELYHFKQVGLPKQEPLFASGIFARYNSNVVNNAFNEWFMNCIEYTNFDQAMLTKIVWAYELKYSAMPYDNIFYKVNKHIPHDTY